MIYAPTYHNVTLDSGVNMHYFEAGSAHNPTLLLLHGFPSSSSQFRDLAPLLAPKYHIIAPDFPGYGQTTAPASFDYTFDNLADATLALLTALQIASYAMYVFDYGAAVGWRLALANPSAITAIISQNGNAYNSGFGPPFWEPIMKTWTTSNSAPARKWLRENYLTLAATKMQYTAGFPAKDQELINPADWTLDYLQNEAGKANQERQLDLFYDYRKNVDGYPAVHEYFRSSQVPLLAIWGKGDPIFIPAGAEAFKKDLPNAVVKFVDAGHFALQTKRWEIAKEIGAFLGDRVKGE
ncbi:Epoxide hydrolase [Fusarium albosuccineum]|uniref:Epoxide hydrolase n=1 Tax=Fusarium albosuccineum TaxID=1237068 RepID=A0A8H4LA73_9HYPO|nr:Epoxide hydrolase [Fusarium albosuccineum]